MVAIIWRESVYKSGKCPQCGTSFGDLSNPRNTELAVKVDDQTGWFVCKGCDLVVARVREYNGEFGAADAGEMKGRWKGGLYD